jgi:hypothetical protein
MGKSVTVNECIIRDTSLRIKITPNTNMSEFDTISMIKKLFTIINDFKEIHILFDCRDSSSNMNLFGKSRIINFIHTMKIPVVECVFLIQSLDSANENKSYFEAINYKSSVNARYTTDPQLANSWLVNSPLVLPLAS